MKKLMMIISYISLIAVVVAPVLFYMGRVSQDTNIIILNAATVVWFVSAMFWMGREKETASE